MEVIKTARQMRAWADEHRAKGERIAFVPTMGALHEGHMSLVARARERCPVVAVSIFVNPLQFGVEQDFTLYPRTEPEDIALLEKAGVQVLYLPVSQEVYPQTPALKLDFGHLDRVLEGEMRPGHFSGVGIVVSRLLHTLMPDVMVLGAKDLQQVAVLRRLITDLAFAVELEIAPTLRENSGLARSSRNMRLSHRGREQAAIIYRALCAGRQALYEGHPSAAIEAAQAILQTEAAFEAEYCQVIDPERFEPIGEQTVTDADELAMAIAGWIEGVRLIDNLIVDRRRSLP